MGEQKLLGNVKQGLLFVLSAPAGTGKTTLVRRLVSEFPCIIQAVSLTTRRMRPGEVEGRDYFFVTEEEFVQRMQNNDFLEYANVFGDRYGTTKDFVDENLAKGKHVFLVIDTQGALQIKATIPSILIFLHPPSIEELRIRLAKRQTESPKAIEKRISAALEELSLAKEYDYKIMNDDFEIAYEVLKSIVIAEEHRIKFYQLCK